MTCELILRDARTVARIVNLAHRFNCRCAHIAASSGPASTEAVFTFDGPATALARLRAQIERIVANEGPPEDVACAAAFVESGGRFVAPRGAP